MDTDQEQLMLFDQSLIPINGNYHIVKENTIIKASYDLNLYEHRVLSVVASKIKPNDDPNQHYYFSIQDFANYFNLDSKKIHSQLKDTLISLRQRTFVLERPNETKRVTGWINWAEIIPSTGYVEVDIDERVRPIFLGIRQALGYTKYQLKYVRNFKSAYAFRLYERCKAELKGEKQKVLSMTFEEIKSWLAITNQYKLYADLKKRVLIPALRDINGERDNEKNGSDICVEIEEIKPGKKVISINFHIVARKIEAHDDNSSYDVFSSGSPPIYQVLTKEQQKIIDEFIAIGIDQAITSKAVEKYGPESLEYMYKYYKNKKPDKPVAYATSVLINGWGIPTNELEKENFEKDAIKQQNVLAEEEMTQSKEQAAATELKENEQAVNEYIDTLDDESRGELFTKIKQHLKNSDSMFYDRFILDDAFSEGTLSSVILHNYILENDFIKRD